MTSYNYTDFIFTHSMHYPDNFGQKIWKEYEIMLPRTFCFWNKPIFL